MEKKSKRHMWDCWVTPRFVSFATKPAPNFKIKVSAKFKIHENSQEMPQKLNSED